MTEPMKVAHEGETFRRMINVNCDTKPNAFNRHTLMTPQQLLKHFAANIKDKDVVIMSVVLQGNRLNVLAGFNNDESHKDRFNYSYDLTLLNSPPDVPLS